MVVDNDSNRLSRNLVESSADGDIYYVYGHGLISEHKGENVNTYHFDYRGSTVAMTNQSGTVIGEAEYDEYGVVLKSTIVTRYMYNGQYGIENDGDGLYYMRTRFYNVDLKKFMNRDVVMGNIQDSQSLNRYAYVNGNPVNFTDPFGMARETVENTQAQAMSGWDKVQLTLDVIGLVPVYGEIADALNVIIYTARGQYKNALLSFGGMVPFFGWAATGGKVYSKISGKLDTAKTFLKKALDVKLPFGRSYEVAGLGKVRDETSLREIYQNFSINKTLRHSKNKMSKHEERISKGINPPKQPNELAVAKYGDIKNTSGPFASKGDNLEGHHTPSKEYLKKYGIKADDGIAVNMHRNRHQATTTYGSGVKRIPEYYEQTPRDALTRDIRELRTINRKAGIDRRETNDAIRSIIKMWDDHPSGLMKKK